MDNAGNFVGWAVTIIGIILVTLAIMLIVKEIIKGAENKEVDCYDRYGNKIIGMKCETNTKEEIIPAIIINLMAGGFAMGIGMNIIKESKEKEYW